MPPARFYAAALTISILSGLVNGAYELIVQLIVRLSSLDYGIVPLNGEVLFVFNDLIDFLLKLLLEGLRFFGILRLLKLRLVALTDLLNFYVDFGDQLDFFIINVDIRGFLSLLAALRHGSRSHKERQQYEKGRASNEYAFHRNHQDWN